MGQNLILNAADHGYKVIAFNRTVSKVDHFLANEAKGKLQNSPPGAEMLIVPENYRKAN
jgi:6-phosphogluconate dehydrogenase